MLHVLYGSWRVQIRRLHTCDYRDDGNAVCSDRQPGNWPMLIASDVPVVLHWYDAHFPHLSLLLSHLLLISCCCTNAIGNDSWKPRYLRVCSARAQKLSDFRHRSSAQCVTVIRTDCAIACSEAAVSATDSATLGNTRTSCMMSSCNKPSFDNLIVWIDLKLELRWEIVAKENFTRCTSVLCITCRRRLRFWPTADCEEMDQHFLQTIRLICLKYSNTHRIWCLNIWPWSRELVEYTHDTLLICWRDRFLQDNYSC